MGLVLLHDNETNEDIWVDTSDKKLISSYRKNSEERGSKLQNKFKRIGIDYINVETNKDYIPLLMQLFQKGGRK